MPPEHKRHFVALGIWQSFLFPSKPQTIIAQRCCCCLFNVQSHSWAWRGAFSFHLNYPCLQPSFVTEKIEAARVSLLPCFPSRLSAVFGRCWVKFKQNTHQWELCRYIRVYWYCCSSPALNVYHVSRQYHKYYYKYCCFKRLLYDFPVFVVHCAPEQRSKGQLTHECMKIYDQYFFFFVSKD